MNYCPGIYVTMEPILIEYGKIYAQYLGDTENQLVAIAATDSDRINVLKIKHHIARTLENITRKNK